MTTFQDLAVAMIKCEQFQGQSVYQHGVSVNKHFEELIYNLENELPLSEWKIPEFVYQYRTELLSNLYDRDIVSKYTIFHDCGKSFCREVDENGKVHFPNHAAVSKAKYLEAGGEEVVANLIGWDMILHESDAVTIEQFLKTCFIKDACTLLFVGLAELHSNAKMFGGIGSTSFKIKYKQLERRGKQICKYYF